MLALVTGATGFIGSHLVDELIHQGVTVRVIVRASSNLRWLPQDRIEIMTGSMQDPDFIAEAMEGVDLIYHVAGTLVADDLEGFRRVNVLPTRLLLEEAAKKEDFKRFLLVSSQGASGPSSDGVPLKEDSSPNPVSDYGRTKLEAEYVALDFADKVPVTIVRPSAVYGPRDSNFLKLFTRVKKGVLPRFGKLERYTNLVHAVDLAKGIYKASISENTKGQLYFMSNESPYAYVELIDAMETSLGVHCKRPIVPEQVLGLAATIARIRKGLTGKTGLLDEQRLATIRERFWTADVSKMKEEMDWVPPTELGAGIQETVKWYQNHGWL